LLPEISAIWLYYYKRNPPLTYHYVDWNKTLLNSYLYV